MLERLMTAIPKGNQKFPLKYYRMLEVLEDRIAVAKNKFMVAPAVRTQGAELLRFMLLNCDLTTAKSFSNDLDRKMQWADSYRDSFRVAFDPVYSKSIIGGKFFANKLGGIPTLEIMLNSELDNSNSAYPFDMPWENWEGLRAIKLLYHNSRELPIEFISNQITFLQKKPTFAVISINTTTLLMKWYKYNLYCEKQGIEADPLDFIKEFELSGVYDDLLEVWLTNLLITVLEHPSADTAKITAELVVPSFITSTGIVDQGVGALKEILSLISNRHVKLQDFLDTRWYPERTIREHLNALEKDIKLPETRLYLWLDMLRVLPVLKMLTAIFEMDKSNPLYDLLMSRASVVYFRQVKLANLPALQYSGIVKSYIDFISKQFEKLFASRQTAGGPAEPIV